MLLFLLLLPLLLLLECLEEDVDVGKEEQKELAPDVVEADVEEGVVEEADVEEADVEGGDAVEVVVKCKNIK